MHVSQNSRCGSSRRSNTSAVSSCPGFDLGAHPTSANLDARHRICERLRQDLPFLCPGEDSAHDISQIDLMCQDVQFLCSQSRISFERSLANPNILPAGQDVILQARTIFSRLARPTLFFDYPRSRCATVPLVPEMIADTQLAICSNCRLALSICGIQLGQEYIPLLFRPPFANRAFPVLGAIVWNFLLVLIKPSARISSARIEIPVKGPAVLALMDLGC